MTLYEFLLTIHILSAILWIGGGFMIYLLAMQFRAAGDGPTLSALGQRAGGLGRTFFMPLAVVQLLSGIWLVLEGDWGFEDLWIIAGIAGIVASSVLGAVFLGPTGEKLGEAAAARGIDDPEVQSGLDRIFLLNRIDLAILVLVVLDMVVKPGL